MPRPPLDRQVAGLPVHTLFKPAGVPGRELEELIISLDEYEALRLADLEGLYQEAAALRMGVSRQTFGRIISTARRKSAEAIILGKALRISGGNTVVKEYKGDTMKIAVPTKDGQVDAHFGHCDHYTVFSVEDGSIKNEETLQGSGQCGCKSGIAGELARMGVQQLVAGNIGEGAVRVLASFGIQTVRGAQGPVRQAAEAFLAGSIQDTGANCAEHGSGHPCHS